MYRTGNRAGKYEKVTRPLFYDLLFSEKKTRDMSKVAKILVKRLKVRDKLLDEQEDE